MSAAESLAHLSTWSKSKRYGANRKKDDQGPSHGELSTFQTNLERSTTAQRMRRSQATLKNYTVKAIASIDYPLVRKWIKTCDRHAVCRERPAGSAELNMLIIDCWEMKITSIKSSELYFALSYVWGGTTPLQLLQSNFGDLCNRDSLTGLKREISRTVWDAITFVKEIGGRYLWVDRLCIIQNNEEVKRNGIKHMDVIYESAWAVIIAGAGADTNAGLPGIYRRFERGKGKGVIRHRDLNEDSLSETVYETRAWT